MTASSFSASRKGNRKSAGSSSPTPPRKSRSRAKSSPSAAARSRTTAAGFRSTSSRATLILFGKYSGQEIKLDGEEFLIMREDEVLAVIDSGTGAAKSKK